CQSNGRQYKNYHDHAPRIARTDAEEEARQQTSQAQRSQDPESESEGGEKHSAPKHQPKLVPTARTPRRSHAQFMRALRDGVGDNSVDSNGGEHHRQAGE